MRHRSYGRKLGRTTEHRWALFRNLASSLVLRERIETTLPKAKDLRPFADHLITLAKRDSLWARRQAFDFLRSRDLVGKLFSELRPRFEARKGGYTRIYKLGYRLGDSAPMAVIEYLPGLATAQALPVKEEKKAPKKTEKQLAKKTEPKAMKKAAKPKKEPPAKKEAGSKKKAATSKLQG